MTRSAVALGSNLGDRLAYMREGLAGLHTLGTVISVSSLYETEPVGGPEQGRYLNAVAIVDTDLPPLDLLAALNEIEAGASRLREERWGPRTLDLDIISYGGESIDGPSLQVPHPRAAERRFVLEPLVEVAPNTRLHGDVTARHALSGVRTQKVFRWDGLWEVSQPTLGWRGMALVAGQFVLFAVLAVLAVSTMSLPIPAWRAIVGSVLALIGGWLVVGALVGLGSGLSALPDPVPHGVLVDRGVFGFVRHPIYGGLLVGGVGMTVTLGTWWPLPVLVVLGLLLWFKSGLEERALTLRYPEYDDYIARVRRRFVPFVV